jgi:hypothetical protein
MNEFAITIKYSERVSFTISSENSYELMKKLAEMIEDLERALKTEPNIQRYLEK